jgi:hypothetical protein
VSLDAETEREKTEGDFNELGRRKRGRLTGKTPKGSSSTRNFWDFRIPSGRYSA